MTESKHTATALARPTPSTGPAQRVPTHVLTRDVPERLFSRLHIIHFTVGDSSPRVAIG